MQADGKWTGKKVLVRLLMVLPPVLFILYTTHSAVIIRSLLSSSSVFHLDFANDLVQDYLGLETSLEIEQLTTRLITGEEPISTTRFVGLEPDGEAIATIETGAQRVPVYLKHSELGEQLPAFFSENKGLDALFTKRFENPVYWFQIIGPDGQPIYQSAQRPERDINAAIYPMPRSLKGYQIEIIYNSFGAKQLYSVARHRINFGAIFFLFILAIFSAVLITRSIRQKLVLARQKTLFVSTVSHEFKTPLAVMRLAGETLAAERYKSDKEKHKFQAMLTNEINRLDHLVGKILNFNNIERGHLRYKKSEFDLRAALKPSLEVFQARARSEGITLSVSAVCHEPCPVLGSPPLLRHAVDNILDNAFKYRGDSKLIEFICERDDRHVKLCIRDHGIGIAKEELPHILKSFYRVHDTNTHGIRGSGLGLAISDYIIKQAGARLHIDSEPGRGSTFTLTFPLLKTKADMRKERVEQAIATEADSRTAE